MLNKELEELVSEGESMGELQPLWNHLMEQGSGRVVCREWFVTQFNPKESGVRNHLMRMKMALRELGKDCKLPIEGD